MFDARQRALLPLQPVIQPRFPLGIGFALNSSAFTRFSYSSHAFYFPALRRQ
jgi:hypothetical protein